MTEEKKDRKNIFLRVPTDLSETMDKYANAKGLTLNDVGIKAFENLIKYDMASEGWELRALEDYVGKVAIEEESKKRLMKIGHTQNMEDISYSHDLKELSKERDRKHDFDLTAFKRLLISLPDDEVKKIFYQRLMERRAVTGEEYTAIPEQLNDGKLRVKINGWEKIVEALDEKGFPSISNFDGELVKCANGFHVKNKICRGCDQVSICSTIRKERMNIE